MEIEECERDDVKKREMMWKKNLSKRKKSRIMVNIDNSSTVTQQTIKENINESRNATVTRDGLSDATVRKDELSDATESITSKNIRHNSRHFPTFSSSQLTAAASDDAQSSNSDASNTVKKTSSKATSKNAPEIIHNNRNNSGNHQGNSHFIKDLCEDKVATGELNGQISVPVLNYRMRTNHDNDNDNNNDSSRRWKTYEFRTPLQSPTTFYVKYCKELLMAPKKRPCTNV